MMPSYEDLQAQVHHLKTQLAGVVGSVDYKQRLRTTFAMQPKHAALLALLMGATRPVHGETLYSLVYEYDNGDGPGPNIVRVGISQMRRIIEAHGCPFGIYSAYGSGCYSITPELRAWVSERVPA